ncbi:uncharacterized protein LOC128390609 [Panonychus citri]|uniref:uncharacterized protein LOC128390609 n=1 Tax=Panonychus citri TaxID=50023 RepID=UPI0023081EA9|nr:uncharacterized protein LOC128390609 [Panonychus citri]
MVDLFNESGPECNSFSQSADIQTLSIRKEFTGYHLTDILTGNWTRIVDFVPLALDATPGYVFLVLSSNSDVSRYRYSIHFVNESYSTMTHPIERTFDHRNINNLNRTMSQIYYHGFTHPQVIITFNQYSYTDSINLCPFLNNSCIDCFTTKVYNPNGNFLRYCQWRRGSSLTSGECSIGDTDSTDSRETTLTNQTVNPCFSPTNIQADYVSGEPTFACVMTDGMEARTRSGTDSTEDEDEQNMVIDQNGANDDVNAGNDNVNAGNDNRGNEGNSDEVNSARVNEDNGDGDNGNGGNGDEGNSDEVNSARVNEDNGDGDNGNGGNGDEGNSDEVNSARVNEDNGDGDKGNGDNGNGGNGDKGDEVNGNNGYNNENDVRQPSFTVTAIVSERTEQSTSAVNSPTYEKTWSPASLNNEDVTTNKSTFINKIIQKARAAPGLLSPCKTKMWTVTPDNELLTWQTYHEIRKISDLIDPEDLDPKKEIAYETFKKFADQKSVPMDYDEEVKRQ